MTKDQKNYVEAQSLFIKQLETFGKGVSQQITNANAELDIMRKQLLLNNTRAFLARKELKQAIKGFAKK